MADKKGRINEIIKRNLSEIIIYDLKNEITRYASITDIRITPDYSYCKVYVNHIDTNKNENLVNFLNKRKGLIRTLLAKKISIYKTPELSFYIDENLTYFNKINKLIEEVNSKKPYTLEDYKKDKEKSNKLSFSMLKDDLSKLSNKVTSKNNIKEYHLNNKDLNKLIDKYKGMDTSSFLLNESYEINLIYFSIQLDKLNNLSNQIDFILKNEDFLLCNCLLLYIVNYLKTSSLKDDNPILISLLVGNNLTKSLYYISLTKYLEKNNVEKILNTIKIEDKDDEMILDSIINLIYELYFIDQKKIYHYLNSDFLSSHIVKMIINKLINSNRLTQTEINKFNSIII